MRILGASLSADDIVPFFQHPSDPSLKVHVLLDVCHMLKLASHSIIIDGQGKMVRWSYWQELYKLQEAEGLHLGKKQFQGSEASVKFINKYWTVCLTS